MSRPPRTAVRRAPRSSRGARASTSTPLGSPPRRSGRRRAARRRRLSCPRRSRGSRRTAHPRGSSPSGEGPERCLERADNVATPPDLGRLPAEERTRRCLPTSCVRAACSTSAARATVSRWRHARDEEENERSLRVARRNRASPGSSYRCSARPSSRETRRGTGRSGGSRTTGDAPYAACAGKPGHPRGTTRA